MNQEQDQTMPMSTVPMRNANDDTVPMQSVNDDTVLMQSAPTEAIPIDTPPTQAPPTDATPTQAIPVGDTDDQSLTQELTNVADVDDDTITHADTVDDATIAMQQAAHQYTQESQAHGYPGADSQSSSPQGSQDAYAAYPGWQNPNARTLPKTKIIPASGPSIATIIWGVILAIIGVIGLTLVAGMALSWSIPAQTWGLLAIVIFVAIGLILVVTGIAAAAHAGKNKKENSVEEF